jgi:acyl carrier protein
MDDNDIATQVISVQGRPQSFDEAATEIKQIISDIIEIPVDELNCDAHFVEELGVDSLLALEMLAALEKRFKIQVPEEDLMQFTTVNKVIKLAGQKLGFESGAGQEEERVNGQAAAD